jgi:hypothetical protein
MAFVMLLGCDSLILPRAESILLSLEEDGVVALGSGVSFRLARRLALYIASSAASSITVSRWCPVRSSCSSLENCFSRILSGKVKNHETSVDDTDDCRLVFRRRALGGLVFGDCLESFRKDGFTPRRSARDCRPRIGPVLLLIVKEFGFCANLKRSSVEKYYRKALASEGGMSKECGKKGWCINICRYQ